MSIDLLQAPADPTEPHLILTVHRSLRLPPLIRRLGPGVYHLAVDIRPLLRGRWRQPVAAGLVTFEWWDGAKAAAPAAPPEAPVVPFTAPQIDATPPLGPDTVVVDQALQTPSEDPGETLEDDPQDSVELPENDPQDPIL